MTTRVAIPLYKGMKGTLTSCFYSRDGVLKDTSFTQATPIQVYDTSGATVSSVRFNPTILDVRSVTPGVIIPEVELVLWDKVSQSVKKKMAVLHLDLFNNKYRVDVEDYYAHMKLVVELNLYSNPLVVIHKSQAYRNNTPYGDWAYKDKA